MSARLCGCWKWFLLFAMMMVVLASPGCGGPGGPGNTPDDSSGTDGGDDSGGDGGGQAPDGVGAELGTGGGTLASANGQAHLVVPAGALASATIVTIGPVDDYPAGVLPGTVFHLEPDGLSFASPALLTLEYSPTSIPAGVAEEELVVAKLVGDAWEDIAGSEVDTASNTVSAPLAGFSTYGIASPLSPAVASETAYVVDTPDPARPDQFTDLAEAVDYVCSILADGEVGRVVVQTNRELAVDALTLDCPLQFDVDEGYEARVGGGDSTLVVTSAGALGFSGFAFGGAVLFNASGDISLLDNVFDGSVIVNIGGAEAAGTAGVSAREGGIGSRWDVVENQLLGSMTLNVNAEVGADGRCNVVENTGVSCDAHLNAAFGGELEFTANPFENLTIDGSLKASAVLNAADQASLDLLKLDLDLQDSPDIRLDTNVSATMDVNLKGAASATLTLTSPDVTTGKFNFSVDNLQIDGTGGEIQDFLADIIDQSDVNWTQDGLSVPGPFMLRIGSEDAKLEATLKHLDAAGNFEVEAGGDLRLHLTEETTLAVQGHITATGNVAEVTATQFTGQGGLLLDAGAVTAFAGLSVGEDSTLADDLGFRAPFGVSTAGKVADVQFVAGAAFHFEVVPGLGGRGRDGGSGSIRQSPMPEEISVRNVQFTDSAEGNAMEFFCEHDTVPIVIEDCVIKSTNHGVVVNGQDGPTTIRRTSFDGGGLALEDVNGPLTVEDQCPFTNIALQAILMVSSPNTANSISGSTISLIGAASGLYVERGSRLTLTDSTIAGGLGAALLLVENAALHASGNTVSGVVIITGGSRARLTGNTFAGNVLSDDEGGLVVDPVASNSGLNPELVSSPIDFDGNDCADYPPPQNEKDEEDICVQEGIPIPADTF